MTWFKKLMSAVNDDAEIKRFAFLVLLAVHVISLFLIMYLKIEIANKSLVSSCLDWNSWLILGTGGLVGLEPMLQKWKPGGPNNVITQEVKEQTVINSDKTEVNGNS